MSLMKGAFVVFQTPAPVPTDIIVFQFNSEALTRKVEPPAENQPSEGSLTRGSKGSRHQTRVPTETLTVTIDLDAADQLADGDPIATAVGVHPALAQLELLLYPPSALMLLNKGLALAGIATVAPTFTPLVLFVWGATRLLPVQVTSLHVVEQQFDNRLNPITARAEVSLRVLVDEELAEPFKTLATVLHIGKEALARVGTVQSAVDITSLLPF